MLWGICMSPLTWAKTCLLYQYLPSGLLEASRVRVRLSSASLASHLLLFILSHNGLRAKECSLNLSITGCSYAALSAKPFKHKGFFPGGWLARDASLLQRIGDVLLKPPSKRVSFKRWLIGLDAWDLCMGNTKSTLLKVYMPNRSDVHLT